MRRVFVFVLTAAVTATGILWWLHDGDLMAAIEPVVADWNADRLAADAGLGDIQGTVDDSEDVVSGSEGLVTETPPD